MPTFGLLVKLPEAEGVGKVIIPADKPWVLDLVQSDGEETRSKVEVDPSNVEKLEGSKGGEANLVIKFEGSKKKAFVKIVNVGEGYTQNVCDGTNEHFQCVAAFECRGCEPTAWYPGCGFKVTSTDDKTTFEDVDLDEEWCDYCEAQDLSVQIMSVEHKFMASYWQCHDQW